MTETVRFVCIGCPMGCPLQLDVESNQIKEVSGYDCNRGAKYARQEFTDPRRGISTSIAISGGRWNRLPVKVTGPIPKNRVMEAAREIHALRVEAPVKMGQIIMRDILGEKDIHVVATRNMDRLAPS